MGTAPRRNKTYDTLLELQDLAAITASAAGEVDSTAVIRDVGLGLFEGEAVIDVTAILITDNDEKYVVDIQGSNSATFASGIETLATIEFGAKEVLRGDVDTALGRTILPFNNEHQGVSYRYIRQYLTTGTGTTESITMSNRVGKK